MQEFISEIQKLQQTALQNAITQRLQEFQQMQQQSSEKWFSELCFCLLTANAKARTALQIQQQLGFEGFFQKSKEELTLCIKENKHRFHNTKAKYIFLAREHRDIKEKIMKLGNEKEMREWLVQNIKGFGYKEASHFLRNVGFLDVAILDRHILEILFEKRIIKIKPKSLTKKKYLAIEKKMEKLCTALQMSQAELDLYLWYMKTGGVLK